MTTELFTGLPRVAAVQGGGRDLIQALLSQLAVSWRDRGLRIAGVVEEFTAENDRETVVLRDLKSDACFPLYQDLGSGSTSCSLNSRRPRSRMSLGRNRDRTGVRFCDP